MNTSMQTTQKSAPKAILITGGSSGIGAALAVQYAAQGVFLALSGRDVGRLEAVQAQCAALGAVVEVKQICVTDRTAMAAWIADVDVRHPLDLVIANAGISGGTGEDFFHGEDFHQARSIFDVNLMGVLNTIEPAIERMKIRGTGQIAIMSSLAGFRGWPGAPAYSASKGAVRFYGEALRGSLRRTGIKVNVICPGFVVSRMTDANDFPMPALMETDKAARIIVDGLNRNRGRICFPFSTAFVVWFLSVLPDCVAQFLQSGLPAKAKTSTNG